MLRIYSSKNDGELTTVISILHSDRIPFFVHNAPSEPLFDAFFRGDRKEPSTKSIMVPPEHAATAALLLKRFFGTRN